MHAHCSYTRIHMICMWHSKSDTNDKVEMIIVIPRPLISSCFQHYWAIFFSLLFFRQFRNLKIIHYGSQKQRTAGQLQMIRIDILWFFFVLSFSFTMVSIVTHKAEWRREWIDNRILEGRESSMSINIHTDVHLIGDLRVGLTEKRVAENEIKKRTEKNSRVWGERGG